MGKERQIIYVQCKENDDFRKKETDKLLERNSQIRGKARQHRQILGKKKWINHEKEETNYGKVETGKLQERKDRQSM